MSDVRLRRLERTWRDTGTPVDLDAFVRELVRSGQLDSYLQVLAAEHMRELDAFFSRPLQLDASGWETFGTTRWLWEHEQILREVRGIFDYDYFRQVIGHGSSWAFVDNTTGPSSWLWAGVEEPMVGTFRLEPRGAHLPAPPHLAEEMDRQGVRMEEWAVHCTPGAGFWLGGHDRPLYVVDFQVSVAGRVFVSYAVPAAWTGNVEADSALWREAVVREWPRCLMLVNRLDEILRGCSCAGDPDVNEDFFNPHCSVHGTPHWEANPDERTRELVRRAHEEGTPEAYVTAARARKRAGEHVEPWELYEASHLFIQAARSWRWLGTKAQSKNPLRVEGRRFMFRRGHRMEPYKPECVLVDGLGAYAVGEPDDRAALLYAQKLVHGFWSENFWWDVGAQPSWVSSDEIESERFYVVPCAYPLRLTEAPGRGREEEAALHAQAVDWYVAQGAIPFDLPETADVRTVAEGGQVGALSTPEARADYLGWWSVYRRRVLIMKKHKLSAAKTPGNWNWEPGSVDLGILIPAMWDTVRFMTKTRRGWRNNYHA